MEREDLQLFDNSVSEFLSGACSSNIDGSGSTRLNGFVNSSRDSVGVFIQV